MNEKTSNFEDGLDEKGMPKVEEAYPEIKEGGVLNSGEKNEIIEEGLESPKDIESVNLDSERNKLKDLIEKMERLQEEAEASVGKLKELRESMGFPPNDEKTASQKAFEEVEDQVEKQKGNIDTLLTKKDGEKTKESEIGKPEESKKKNQILEML